MAWARLDDRFHDNRKVRRAWRRCPAAIGLHVMAITYCAGHLTDGVVDLDFVEDRMPSARLRDRAVGTLVDAGLWHVVDDGWKIHDFAEFNGTRAEVEARRAAKSEAGKKGANARWGDGKPMAGAIGGPCEGDSASSDGEMRIDAPDPTRPVSHPPTSTREVDPVVVRLTEQLADRVRANDPKASPNPASARWLTDMRLLLADRNGDAAEIARIIDWCQADGFWRSNILSPGKLRKQFTQLVLKAGAGNVVSMRDVKEQEKRERQERRLAALDDLVEQGRASA